MQNLVVLVTQPRILHMLGVYSITDYIPSPYYFPKKQYIFLSFFFEMVLCNRGWLWTPGPPASTSQLEDYRCVQLGMAI